MNKSKNLRLHSIIFIVFVVFCIVGCSTTLEKAVEKLSNGKTIAIIPFINCSGELILKNSDSKTSTLKDKVTVEDLLTDALAIQLKNRGFKHISILPKLPDHENQKLSLKTIKQGLSGDTDVIIVSRIFRFKERRGNDYSVSFPASVAFDIRVINTLDGKILHHYDYNETQKTLSENILGIKKFILRKGRWVRAMELARYGLDEGIKKIID